MNILSPTVGQKITINNIKYTFQEHPASPGIPFGASGKRATVYQLSDGEKKFALKVFIPQFREPRMVSVAEKLSMYAGFPGLCAANRIVLTGSKHIELLKQEKDLSYAVLMPWIVGYTWGNYCLSKMPLSPEQSLNFSRAFTKILLNMEENGLAHCDLSSSNFILQDTSNIELIDLEEMYGSEFKKPKNLPAGSPGYAHSLAAEGLWFEEADRFAGAVLIAEILGWRSEKVRKAAWEDSYFKPDEMQTDCERYQILQSELLNRWGKSVSDLFAQAWFSDSLRDCPTFSDWMIALPDEVPAVKPNISKQEEGNILTDATSEDSPVNTWTCSHCGKEVLITSDLCPYCENGERKVTPPVEQQKPEWTCPNCTKTVSGDLDVCPYCEGGIIDPPSKPRIKLWAGGIIILILIGFIFLLKSGGIIPPKTPAENTPKVTPSVTSTITASPEPTNTITPTPTMTFTPSPTIFFPQRDKITSENINQIKPLLKLEGMRDFYISSSEHYIVAWNYSNNVEIWDLENLEKVFSINPNFIKNYFTNVEISADDKYLFLSGYSSEDINMVIVYDLVTRKNILSFEGRIINSDNTNSNIPFLIISNEKDETTFLLNKSSLETENINSFGSKKSVFSPDNSLLAIQTTENILIYNTIDFEVISTISIDAREGYSPIGFDFMQNNNLFILGGNSYTLKIWQMPNKLTDFRPYINTTYYYRVGNHYTIVKISGDREENGFYILDANNNEIYEAWIKNLSYIDFISPDYKFIFSYYYNGYDFSSIMKIENNKCEKLIDLPGFKPELTEEFGIIGRFGDFYRVYDNNNFKLLTEFKNQPYERIRPASSGDRYIFISGNPTNYPNYDDTKSYIIIYGIDKK